MPPLSFRFKLLLAMMLVVAGATGTALYVSQQSVRETYQNLFEQQSRAQIKYFTSLQEARLSFIKEKCLDLVNKSVRLRAALQAALEEGEAESVNLLYTRADDELRDVRRDAAFVFLDAKGRVLARSKPDGRPGDPADRPRFQQQLALIGREMSAHEQQQVGVLAGETPEGRWQLQEIVVTKVVDPLTHQTLGALLLAFPVPDLWSGGKRKTTRATGAPRPALPSGAIKFGIWLDGRFYSRDDTIPEPLQAGLAEKISGHLWQEQTDFLIWPDTDPHRVFVQALNPVSGLPAAHQVCLYSLAEARAVQQELQTRILIFGGLTLLGALAISLVLTHGLSVPLRELVTGTNEIQRGNFAFKVRVRGRDDIGRLAASFNDMAVGLALKEKYRTVLNLVADEKVAQQLIDNQAVLGGELREVSVLFCDIRGFTALTQTMPPELVIDMLNEHMTALTRVVKRHHGVLDKFVGDSLMAIFGAPVSHENDAINASTCALDLILEREQLNNTSRHQLQIGIGIATGTMVAGCMGSADRLNYTVLGERVNLAARLCSHANPGEAIIDQTTRERLGDAITVTPLPALILKGFSENVPAYELQQAGGTTLLRRPIKTPAAATVPRT